MCFSKTLNFSYENLARGGTLLFAFDQQNIAGQQMYKDYYPLVWQVAYLQQGGTSQFSTTYLQLFSLINAQIQSGDVTTGSASTRIKFQERSTLIGDSMQGYNWTDPEKIETPGNVFEANNGTKEPQGICVGIQNATARFSNYLLYFDGVEPGTTVQINFSDRLRIYAVENLQQGSAIMTEITSAPLWDHALDEVNLPENWTITFNPLTGDFEINPAK